MPTDQGKGRPTCWLLALPPACTATTLRRTHAPRQNCWRRAVLDCGAGRNPGAGDCSLAGGVCLATPRPRCVAARAGTSAGAAMLHSRQQRAVANGTTCVARPCCLGLGLALNAGQATVCNVPISSWQSAGYLKTVSVHPLPSTEDVVQMARDTLEAN